MLLEWKLKLKMWAALAPFLLVLVSVSSEDGAGKKVERVVHQEEDFRAPDFDFSKLEVRRLWSVVLLICPPGTCVVVLVWPPHSLFAIVNLFDIVQGGFLGDGRSSWLPAGEAAYYCLWVSAPVFWKLPDSLWFCVSFGAWFYIHIWSLVFILPRYIYKDQQGNIEKTNLTTVNWEDIVTEVNYYFHLRKITKTCS